MGFRGGRMKRFLALLLACTLIALIATGSLADVGGFAGGSDYGSSGGGGDWGSSSSDWSSSSSGWGSSSSDWGTSSSDWGSSSFGPDSGGGYIFTDAGGFSGSSDYGSSGGSSDWGSSSSDWGSSSSDWGSGGGFLFFGGDGGSGGGFGTFIVIAVLALIVYSAYKRSSRSGAGRPVAPGGSYSTPQGNNIGVNALRMEDPNFSEQVFLEDIANRYVKLQQAWMAKDWEPMRMLMTDTLYAQFERQLGELIRARQTNRVERIAVLGSSILGCWRDDTNDIITVELRTRIVDYVVDDMTGNVVRGDPNKELFMTYEWTLIRSTGVKTEVHEGEHHTSCPSCGAPLRLNASNRCEYCGTLVTASEHDWVISAIRGISQRSS